MILKDKVSITLDTSGAGLHKRGYRADSNDAPIKETLAAAMAELAFVRPNHFVIDPMCGSGTILIEAAQKALKIAPGVKISSKRLIFFIIISYRLFLTVRYMILLSECSRAKSVQKT